MDGGLIDSLDRLCAASPVSVGFEVAMTEQASALALHADVVIVSSALMKAVFEADSPALMVAAAAKLAEELGQAMVG